LKNKAWQEALSVRFRRLLSGDPDGVPPWLGVVAAGEDLGFFKPTDAPWVIHADFGTLVGGIRALLMQALHPGSLTGVKNHSRYEQDPLGRLAGTIRWLTVTTFGSKEAVANEASRVNRLHDRVKGDYQSADSKIIKYRAADADLLLWVHIAFMESFLVAHEMYSPTPIPRGEFETGADNYVAQWSISVKPLGLEKAPLSKADLDAAITDTFERGILYANEDTFRVVDFIRRPPLPRAAKPIYNLLFEAATVSLRPEFAQMLGLKPKPRWVIQPLTRGLLRLMRFAIGPESPIEEAALARIARVKSLQNK
jgi:uncharacterized protein (DUF2236 family)